MLVMKQVAARALKQHRRHLARLRRSVSQAHLHVGFDRLEIERMERDLLTLPMQRELCDQAADTHLGGGSIGGPGRRQHHEPCVLGAASDMCEPVERGGVAPVNVFELNEQPENALP